PRYARFLPLVRGSTSGATPKTRQSYARFRSILANFEIGACISKNYVIHSLPVGWIRKPIIALLHHGPLASASTLLLQTKQRDPTPERRVFAFCHTFIHPAGYHSYSRSLCGFGR